MKHLLKKFLVTGMLSLSLCTNFYAMNLNVNNDGTQAVLHDVVQKNNQYYIQLDEGLKLFNGSVIKTQDDLIAFKLPLDKNSTLVVAIQMNSTKCAYKIINPNTGEETEIDTLDLEAAPFVKGNDVFIGLIDFSTLNLKEIQVSNGTCYFIDYEG